MKYDYFVSARWRNRPQVEELVNKLREKGKTVYSFIETNSDYPGRDRDPEVVMTEFEALPNWVNDPVVRKIYERDLEGLKESENFIVLLPVGTSGNVEIGIAFGLGKKCIAIGDMGKTETLYLLFSEMYKDIDDFISNLP